MAVVGTTSADVTHAVRELGLSGKPLCIHSSLRSFGPVVGGADAVIDGLLDAGGTVLVPTFSDMFDIPPPPDLRPERNGWNYAAPCDAPEAKRSYTPATNEVNAGMGAIPKALLSRAGRQRGNHALNSFAALGPDADELIAGQAPRDVYAPLRALVERDGWVVLMGVGLTRMTLLHLAELTAGRSLFLRWANDRDGQPMYVEIGSCSEGFDVFEPALAPLAREVRVGDSRWRAFPAGAVIDAAASAIRENPAMTHCGRPGCNVCPDAVRGGPVSQEA
jgi:aminoglycoside 3-N-acetyltransferase